MIFDTYLYMADENGKSACEKKIISEVDTWQKK